MSDEDIKSDDATPTEEAEESPAPETATPQPVPTLQPGMIPPPAGMPAPEAEKWMRAQRELLAKASGQQADGQPQAPNPDTAAPQGLPQQVVDQAALAAAQQAMQAEIEATQRMTGPYLAMLQQKLMAHDDLALDLVGDISHACAQLVRYLSDSLVQTGQGQAGAAARQSPSQLPDGRMAWPFVVICSELFRAPILNQYTQNPGPNFWLQYVNHMVVPDLKARVEKIQEAKQVLAAMRQQSGHPPQPTQVTPSFRPGVKPRQPGEKRTSTLGTK